VTAMTHTYRIRRAFGGCYPVTVPFGAKCRVVRRGARGNVLIELEDGRLVVTSRWAISVYREEEP
jgi:hypothetical protein